MNLTALPADAAALAPVVGSPAPEVWVLLWSHSQNALHIERLTDMHQTNLEAFSEDRPLDYIPLQIGSRDAVDMAANVVRPIVHAREEARAARREVI